jgi:ubiquinol-cytochrome c reductase cytochrome c1 subunit
MRPMKKPMRALLGVVVLAVTLTVSAQEAGLRLEPAPAHRLDMESLQRGARNFANYCANCHSAQYMRYNRLTDLGIGEQEIRDNLMFATDKIGATMLATIPKADAAAWFGTAPPDLSVEARIRGKDWLYSYLLGFYRDEKTATGWNNLVFNNVSMPHVLWERSGVQRLIETEYEDEEKAEAALIAAKGLALAERVNDHKYVVKTLTQDATGTMQPVEYKAFVADLVNYLDYIGEPVRNERINIGIGVLIYLGILLVFAYALKRAYWKDVH